MDKSHLKPKERFSGLAEVYAAARPTYPAEAVDFVVSRCSLGPDTTLVDIGCGTGISSRPFAQHGVTVIGIEPNDDMRSQAQSQNSEGRLTYAKGTAEKTNLESASVDGVLAAQAFHWFETEPTLIEFHRILKPGGWAILIWNERADGDPFTTEYGAIIRARMVGRDIEALRGKKAGQPLLESKLFVDGDLSTFANEQVLSGEGLLMRACSASYAPKEGEQLDLMRQELDTLFKRFAKNDVVAIKYETFVFTARKPL